MSSSCTATARKRRPVAATGFGVLLAVALVLSFIVSPWFLVAIPVMVPLGYGAWLGLSHDEILEATKGWDDPGGGPAGMSP